MKIKILTIYLCGCNASYMQRFSLTLLLISSFEFLIAQTNQKDSTRVLEAVVVTAFEQQLPLHRSPIAVSVLNRSTADFSNKTSMVSGFNTQAGVRMEERSPASYRVNIRGSSLRSPFWVRNVKVYWNDIPLTDPGGNTYLNQLALNNFSSIEIYKGPVSSMYGAGTGGLLLMHSLQNHLQPQASLEYMGGSYGLHNAFASSSFGNENNLTSLTYAHNSSEGYRDHSKMRRNNASFVSRNKISSKQQLTAAVLFTDLFYQTPGGLTKTEYEANPKAARPAAGGQPSAEQAQAAIYQKNILIGVHHLYSITDRLKNATALYGAFAQVKNPTFRNYERRNEPHFGGRTSFIFNREWNDTKIQFVTGGEFQQGYFNTQVSRNRQGSPDTLQTNDDIRFTIYSVFFQTDAELLKKLFLTAGISVNKSEINITRLNRYPVITQSRTYGSEWSPRVALLYKLTNDVGIYANLSKGFSPPTTAEVLPSTGVISTFLEAEEGINYELGVKGFGLNGKLYFEWNGFYFRLNNALVVRKDSSNADYYVNAGNTDQIGLEFTTRYNDLIETSILRRLGLSASYALSNFEYEDFQKENVNFSGNQLPGVPQHVVSFQAELESPQGIYLRANCYLASKIYLNDANTAEADPYHIVGLRIGYNLKIQKSTQMNIFVGADNLLNETYSLGNDINAAGGRYYNAAPARNYYAGLAFDFSKRQ